MSPERPRDPCKECGGLGYLVGRSRDLATAEVCACTAECKICDGRRYLIDRDEDGYELATPCTCQSAARRVGAFNAARLPGAYSTKTVENFNASGKRQQRLKLKLLEYQRDFDVAETAGLVLIGNPGTGKTHLLSGLVRYLTLERGVQCRYVDFFELCARIRESFNQASDQIEADILGPLIDVDVLVIDELGKGRGTSWEQSVVDQLISKRYNADRPILATSNYKPEAWLQVASAGRAKSAAGERLGDSLEERVGMRIFSRLAEMCTIEEIDGADHRLQALRQ